MVRSTGKVPITKEEAKKSLYYSIVVMILIALFFVLILNLSQDLLIIMMFIPLLTMYFFLGFISFIMYFLDNEMAYGMWISRKKAKELKKFKRIQFGRRVRIVILIMAIIPFIMVLISLLGIMSG